MNEPALNLPRWPHDGLSGLRREMLLWWAGQPELLRSRAWPSAFAGLTILGLLLGFHQVVSSAVKQGELLRMSAATRSQAEWRCHALRSAAMRASCLEQLDAPVIAEAPTAPANTATLAQLGR
jgi:hypothetical protein